MKKHETSLRSLQSPAVRLGLLLCLLCSTTCVHADDPAVVRLSFTAGTVQASAGKTSSANPAVMNMPLFDGSIVTTAADGQAEIEFADGSVARLTPNSQLELTHLQRIGPSGHTDLTLLSGLAYFELNVGQGQRFTVKLGPATLRPIENSIFRLSLDSMPNASVMQGAIHIEGQDGHVEGVKENSGLDTDVSANQYVSFDPADPAQYTLNQSILADSWDQWNADRDAAIAQMSASQTAVRDDSRAPEDPGWNDLDYYGNWYPVEGYGDVWTPSDVGSDWDPFGYGYWGNYSGYGATWISGYPWGWLPYHCGAWNYFQFGWGWVPGGCGMGWSPVVTVWNTPSGYRLPGWPKGPGMVPSQHRPPLGGGLIAVDRGPAARGPWNKQGGTLLLHNRGLQNTTLQNTTGSAPSLQVEGNTILPLPRVSTPVIAQAEGQVSDRVVINSGPHVGVPVSANAYRLANPVGDRSAQPLAYGGQRNNVERGLGSGESASQPHAVGRPTYSTPARSAPPAPAPHASAPPPAAAGHH